MSSILNLNLQTFEIFFAYWTCGTVRNNLPLHHYVSRYIVGQPSAWCLPRAAAFLSPVCETSRKWKDGLILCSAQRAVVVVLVPSVFPLFWQREVGDPDVLACAQVWLQVRAGARCPEQGRGDQKQLKQLRATMANMVWVCAIVPSPPWCPRGTLCGPWSACCTSWLPCCQRQSSSKVRFCEPLRHL